MRGVIVVVLCAVLGGCLWSGGKKRGTNLPPDDGQVVDINNGARFETYAIAGERGSMAIQVNGAAARLVQPDDLIIVMSFADFEPDELADHTPVVIDLSPR